MTEAEWLRCTEPYDMLMDFPAKWGERRLCLFGCACLRRGWHLLKDRRSRSCVEVAERFADDQATWQEFAEVREVFEAAAYEGALEDLVVSYHVCHADKRLWPSLKRVTAGEVAPSRMVQTWSASPAAIAGVRC